MLLRDLEVGRDGLSARDPDRLESARLLDPSVYWDQIRAGVLLLNGDDEGAAAQAEEVTRAEPDNFAAWSLLRLATRRSDPARPAQSTPSAAKASAPSRRTRACFPRQADAARAFAIRAGGGGHLS